MTPASQRQQDPVALPATSSEGEDGGRVALFPALAVRNLSIGIRAVGTQPFLEALDFAVHPGKALAIVGESGSGKSLTALAIMRLLPHGISVSGGEIMLDGANLLAFDAEEMRRARGGRVAMIFQDPMTSLNPAFTVGDQLVEAIRTHQPLNRAAAEARAAELLGDVGIPDAMSRLAAYPHQLSGGMRQRVMIAMALANRPAVLIADEPTTALDVTIQAQILMLLRALQERHRTALLLIAHDLGVVREVADEVLVLYAGMVMEIAAVGELFDDPQHPYTLGLLGALPSGRPGALAAIPGSVPGVGNLPSGCRFNTRCPLATEKCQEAPPLRPITPTHRVACWYAPIEQRVQ